jgi:hypothetical protein
MDPAEGRQESALTDEQVREVVALAALAPSVHNTQPWRFVWDGRALEVHDDPARAVPVIDPTGRERILSCGAAIENATLAVRGLGRTCAVELLPDADQPELLARLTPGAESVASPEEHALLEAVPRRYTDRGRFLPKPVEREVLDRLRAGAESAGAWLRVVERQDEQIALSVLLSHAEEVEAADPAYRDELQRWRTQGPEAEGIPDAAVPAEGVAGRGSDYRLRDFDAGRTDADAGPSMAEPPVPEHPVVVIIGTVADEPRDWLRAGMALGRVLLQATVDDLAASPMTQVVEVDWLRGRLRQELALVGLPQVVLRLGYGEGRMTTHRRPVDEILTITR